jgi:NADH:ubiquinone oxidoreductase subunit 2 (subunit N)
MYFYIGLILNMYFKEQNSNISLKIVYGPSRIALIITALGLLYLSFFPSALLEFSRVIF